MQSQDNRPVYVTMLLSINTTTAESRSLVNEIAAIPNLTLHVDYDDRDARDAYKLNALRHLLADIDTEAKAAVAAHRCCSLEYEEIYRQIADLKIALDDAFSEERGDCYDNQTMP